MKFDLTLRDSDSVHGPSMRRRVDKVELLREKGIMEKRILDAMRYLPRHPSIDEAFEHLAYEDIPLLIGDEQTTSSPYTIAWILESLSLKEGMKDLEIGTGPVYQTVILYLLGTLLFSVEKRTSLAIKAREVIERLGIRDIKLKIGDGLRGWKEFSPFHRILISTAIDSQINDLIEQLEYGGILLFPMIKGRNEQEIIWVTRLQNGENLLESIGKAHFVPALRY